MSLLRAIGWCALTVALASGDALAERVALIGADIELAHATATTLEAWDIAVVSLARHPPSRELARAERTARAYAAAHSARAVVWATGGSAPRLWLFDEATGKVVTVPLSSGPPFDPPTAAEVALIIKTIVRHSAAAPVAERYAVPTEEDYALALESRVGARFRPGPVGTVEPRFGFAAVLRPRSGWLAFAGSLRAGPGQTVEGDEFVGRYQSWALAFDARAILPLAQGLSLYPALGASLRLDRLHGTSISRDQETRASHLNPAGEAGVGLDVRIWRRLRLALWLEGSYRLRHQRFFVGQDEVFDAPAYEGELGLALTVPIW